MAIVINISFSLVSNDSLRPVLNNLPVTVRLGQGKSELVLHLQVIEDSMRMLMRKRRKMVVMERKFHIYVEYNEDVMMILVMIIPMQQLVQVRTWSSTFLLVAVTTLVTNHSEGPKPSPTYNITIAVIFFTIIDTIAIICDFL